MVWRKGMAALLVSVALFALTGCESSKDKAARHLASALELAEKGDASRALVEFRNVFQLDPENLEAYRAFAAFLQGRGDLAGAYGQYQAILDRAPADQPALRMAASLAAQTGNWPEAARLADGLLALVPADPEMTAIQTAAAYAKAVSQGDRAARKAAAQTAAGLLAARPKDLLLHRVVIDDLAQGQDYAAALAAVDRAIAIAPQDPMLYGLRVSILGAKDDKPAVEAALLDMTRRFDDPGIGQTLLRWYVGTQETDKAEAWLRGQITGGKETGAILQAHLQMILFLREFRGPDAALAQIDAALTALTTLPAQEAPDPAVADPATEALPLVTAPALRTLRASLLFDMGQTAPAVAEMQALLTDAPATPETRNIKITLARMQQTLGDQVQARALVEEVLAEEPGHVEAIKMKAAWAIQSDETDAAIALLRGALQSAPRDAQLMTLLAEAYGRAGSRDLQADMLSQAVAAAGKAPAETLRYANFLSGDQKYLPAESLLVEALRLDPANPDLLAALGDLYLRMKDWPRAEGVAKRLEELDTPQTRSIADRLRPALLAAQQDISGAVDYLRRAAVSGDQRAQVALISALLGDGKKPEALAAAEVLLARDPKDAAARFVMASVKGATGDGAGALADYRALVTETPKAAEIWTALIRQTVQTQGQPAAEPLIDEALTHLPDQPDLLLMKANMLELRQDIDGAIAIYDGLYARFSDNQVVANNLASLISSYKTDQASLDRAWAVARRLNGTEVPAFADTYGWLAHLRGQTTEALPYLERAAAGLDQDPLVQFHLAEAYQAAGQPEKAKPHYTRVLELVPEADTRAFVAASRKVLGQ